jgi:PKD repeat protein
MKFSPDGSQLAMAIRYLYSFELDSFDISTGVVSAPVSFPSTNSIQAYGVEFSPDGKLLYTSDDNQTSQYDIQVHDAVSILASKTFISTDVWALQSGPDHKIYLAGYFAPTLSVINDPDVPGTGCNYVSAAVNLVGMSALGLPNQMNRVTGVPVAIFSAPNHICPGTCTDFTNLSTNANSFVWNFPGANPAVSTDANPTQICYNVPGQYGVTLIASNANGSDTLTLPNFITVYPFPSPQGILQNGDTLFANQGAVSYQWFHDGNLIPGATGYYYIATESGNFNVVATDNNGCEVEAVIFDVIARIPVMNEGSMFTYPNPVRNELELVLPDGYSGMPEIKIMDITGIEVRRLLTNPTVSDRWKVDVSDLPAGVYVLNLQDNKHQLITKFVKQ